MSPTRAHIGAVLRRQESGEGTQPPTTWTATQKGRAESMAQDDAWRLHTLVRNNYLHAGQSGNPQDSATLAGLAALLDPHSALENQAPGS
jgi:hypothetical protein